MDPLAGYNPIFEIEHYIDGDHNGGIFNAGNLNVYGYTYQNPIRYIDPNGKQVDVVYFNTKNDGVIINALDDIDNNPKVLTIGSHAGTHGARIVKNDVKGGLIDGPISFDKEISKESIKWNERKKNGNLVVVMLGCNLARDREDKEGNKKLTRLQSISKGHPDEVFIGSTTSVIFMDSVIYDALIGPENEGKWRVYKGGILIDEYDSDWNPVQYNENWFKVDVKEIKSSDTNPAAINDVIPTNPKKQL